MAEQFEQKERRVIPNWRSFNVTACLGELDHSGLTFPSKPSEVFDISDYTAIWRQNKRISFAADLISATFANGDDFTDDAKDAARFVIKQAEKCPPPLIRLAEIIIGKNPHDNTSPPQPGEDLSLSKVYKSINVLRDRLRSFPQNPIPHVELSRCYSILGEKYKAIKNMKAALYLSPENRFIVRAAIRLFAHFGEPEYIHNIVKKSGIVRYDPWVISSEISLADLLGKTSSFIKRGIQFIESKKFDPYSLTELCSSIATVELNAGNRKKARKLLQSSLIAPNDNSLAQVEWINNIDYLFDLDLKRYNVNCNSEALALNSYFENKWNDAFFYSKNWAKDMPFTKRPVLMASHVAISLLNQPQLAIDILKSGLVSHPGDPQLINNLVYSLVLVNKLSQAESLMENVGDISDLTNTTNICLTATSGLIAFRKGNFSMGKDLYLKAIEAGKLTNNPYYRWIPTLCFAREAILSKSENASELLKIVDKVPNDLEIPSVTVLKKEVLDLLSFVKPA